MIMINKSFNSKRVDSVIISIQISDNSQNRINLNDEHITLSFNIGMVCLIENICVLN